MSGRVVAVTVVLGLVAAGCAGQEGPGGEGRPQSQVTDEGPRAVDVQAEEYEFGGVPANLPAGTTTFDVENVGQEPHEFSLARIEGDQPLEELIQLPQNEAEEFVQILGGTFAKPGEAGKPLEVELEAGRYGYVCFVEAPDGEPHALKGMYGEFEVA